MADLSSRLSINSVGKYYVDNTCIDCDLCRQTSDCFDRDEDLGFSYVKTQPTTQSEIEKVEEAIAGCPVNAIGDDAQ
jgi:ferredoxin